MGEEGAKAPDHGWRVQVVWPPEKNVVWKVETCSFGFENGDADWFYGHVFLNFVGDIVKYKGIMIEYPEYPVRICKNHTWLGIPELNEGFNGNRLDVMGLT